MCKIHNESRSIKKKIAILGGGPSGMFMYKRIVESRQVDFEVTIFERKNQLGAGMPYSPEGANDEHITNVSDSEIPEIVTSIKEWVQTLSKNEIGKYGIDPENFNEYRVLPRLLFGQYLAAQFELLLEKAKGNKIKTRLFLESNVIDIEDLSAESKIAVSVENIGIQKFDSVIICTGHHWPKKYEGKIAGYFDSPYPPEKLLLRFNHPVAIKGSSLTAIDAIRTLARANGKFSVNRHHKYHYQKSDESRDFRMVIHSRRGLLPAVRFHLENSRLSNDSLLTPEEITRHLSINQGFLSLDFIFQKYFKDIIREKDPAFYDDIKNLCLEEFAEEIMTYREQLDPFQLLKAEYAEAETSIKSRQSIYWKEMLAVLSIAMNYPAKYLSAEDMMRLQNVLMPLISVVIAFLPQRSCEEILALHNAGVLDIVCVGTESEIKINEDGGIIYHYTDENKNLKSEYFKTFVDCVGQMHFPFEEFPFESLVKNKTVSPATLRFESNPKAVLKVPGITINDNFQVVDQQGMYNKRIYTMAVPYLGGFNPDYSGLDFCEAASGKIMESILQG